MKPMLCALALTILLTGCAVQEELPDESAVPAEDEILLVIDGREVPAWRYLCWLDRAVAQGLDGEAARKQALGDTALYAAVEFMAEEWGVTLTAEEEAALTATVWEGLAEEQWRELAAVGALYGKLCEREVPQETLEAFGKERGYRTVDRILILSGKQEKDDVLNALIETLAEVPEIDGRDEVARGVFHRESLLSTGIGNGIGVPHVRLNELDSSYMALAIVPEGVDGYEALDAKPVKIVFMVVAGKD